MYEPGDTIVAVSSPPSGARAIVRISGPAAIKIAGEMFRPAVGAAARGVFKGQVIVDEEFAVDAMLYLFVAPRSYTGEDIAEIHVCGAQPVVEAVLGHILDSEDTPVRPAGPGEFTARAYLNGRLDLAQVEAVGEIISSSNRFQLAAAERLLAGDLGKATAALCESIIECLGLIEAGLDFSEEDIEFISRADAAERLTAIRQQLEKLLAGSVRYESVMDMPCVGIAGAPNAGKSSLLNRLLGRARSIVCEQRMTTRDILSGLLVLEHCNCVVSDCAGLVLSPEGVLDELAQQAAVEALQRACVVVFCVDVSKSDWSEDVSIRRLIEPRPVEQRWIWVATKCDALTESAATSRLDELCGLLDAEFLPVSAETDMAVELLRTAIDEKLIELTAGSASQARRLFESGQAQIGLAARHSRAVTAAIESLGEAIEQVEAGNDEVAAMMLRAAHQELSDIGRPVETAVDERILNEIFSRFCIGK